MAGETRENIYINSTAIPKPPGFSLEREDIYAAEYTSMSGKHIADRVGWKYADMELAWDALEQSYITTLIGLSGQFTLGFFDESNTYVEENCIRISSIALPLRYQYRGAYWWKEPSFTVRFIDAHNS